MDNIILFNTSFGTRNVGDEIINLCIKSEMSFLLDNNFVINLPTHTPIVSNVQKLATLINKNNWRGLYSSKYKFLCGTNLIKKSLLKINKDWMVGLSDIGIYRNSVAIGCGMELNSRNTDIYTKYIYKHLFNSSYVHSVRDQATKTFFEELGLKAVNTGCPTIWALTPEKCAQINKNKRNSVVFTITDYMKDHIHDKQMIDILINNYKTIYFWPQGHQDLEYFKELNIERDRIKIINSNLNAYSQVLSQNVDYVGTRLHGGIYAMRNNCRAIILIVDNRAREMNRSFQLNAIERNEISSTLEEKINTNWATSIQINLNEIEKWKSQFK